MIIDGVINNLDSSVYHTAEFNDPDLELFLIQGGFRLVTDVSESEFLELRRNPTDETIQKILSSHHYEDHC